MDDDDTAAADDDDIGGGCNCEMARDGATTRLWAFALLTALATIRRRR